MSVGVVAGVLALLAGGAIAASAGAAEPASQEPAASASHGEDLEAIARELNNPLATLWSLQLQSNFTALKGAPFHGAREFYNLAFQPAIPVPLTDSLNVIARPFMPFVQSQPTLDRFGSSQREVGFGDIALPLLFSPAKQGKLLWGAGPTFIFPSGSSKYLSQQKWQAGPALVGVYLGEKWVLGALYQQWWSFAGKDDRPDVNQANVQYFIQRLLPNRWQVGMSPNILFDFKANRHDAVTFPIGLGVGKTVRLGKLPVKFQLEGQYMPIHPDNVTGQRWNIRLQVTPVIPSLIKEPLF